MKLIAFLLGFMLLATTANAFTIYYVAPNGRDSNSGLYTTTPLRTIVRADQLAVPGDTIAVLGEHIVSPFVTNKDGVTFTCIGCKLRPAFGGGPYNVMWYSRGQNVLIQNFEIDGRSPIETSTARIAIYAHPIGPGPVTIKNNHIHHFFQGYCNKDGMGLLSDDTNHPGAVVNFFNNNIHDIGMGSCAAVKGICMNTAGNATTYQFAPDVPFQHIGILCNRM